MVQTIQLNAIPNRCINVVSRKERKKYMITLAKRLGLRVEYYPALMRRDTKRGCLESHMDIIKMGLSRGWKQVFIMEDDMQPTRHLDVSNWTELRNVPDNWAMLYLGGTVKQRLYDETDYQNYEDFQQREWVRMCCWTTHAYVVNLENAELVADLLKAQEQEQQLDHYYLDKIHTKYPCYMRNPMLFIQKDGFSDIERANVSYEFMERTLDGFATPLYKIDEEGNYILKLDPLTEDDLPSVSIVTPTRNRRKLFSIALRNWELFNYPQNKLQWVIVDDTVEDDDTIEDMLPKYDRRIKYCRRILDNPMTVAAKRNWGAQEATHDIILHMDDDDYYPPESVLSRVKILLKYRGIGIECVGSSKYGTYDIVQNKSSMASDGSLSISEASMGYFRSFIMERPFDETARRGEYWSFINGRLNKVMDIPYIAVFIALTHKTNLTGDMRKTIDTIQFRDTQQEANYFDMWDEDTQLYMNSLRRLIDPTLPRLMTLEEKRKQAEQEEHDRRQKQAEENLRKKVNEGRIKMVEKS